MICSVCKKEWVGVQGDTVCPFCGADMAKGSGQHTVPDVIAFLVKKEGADVLLKPDTVMSYISDLVQGQERSKKLIRVGSTNGVFQKAHSILVEPKQSRREVMVLDLKQYLMDSAFLSEENAVTLVNTVLEGIGLSSLCLTVKPVKAEKPAAPKPAEKQPKPAPKKAEKPKQVPVNAAAKQKSASQGGTVHEKHQSQSQFRLNSISTFEYDGSSFSSRKVQGPLFLKGETRMIGILVTYDPVPKSMSVSLDWQIFNQDGSPMTGMIHGGGTISKGDTDFYQGWGWAVPGNWKVGRYMVKASMNGSNQLTAYFDIVDGRYDNPRLTMHEIRLFSAGAVPPSVSERMYSAVFSSHQARRIYFEISLARMNASVYTTMNYKITRENGEIIANYSVPIRFRSGDDRCWTGFGWDNPGHWRKGRYGYEVSIGSVNNLFRGVFDIV